MSVCMCSDLFVKPDGDVYREGDMMYRSQLADTLSTCLSVCLCLYMSRYLSVCV